MKTSIILFLCFFSLSLSAQVFENPAYNQKSHESLIIDKIEITSTNTIIYLSIQNKLEKGGWFCASKDISITGKTTNKDYKLVKSEGIPICPKQYHFTKINEVLKFKLFFAIIDTSDNIIDLTEHCNQACFFFKNIILDNTFSKKLSNFEKGLEFISAKNYEKSIQLFESVLQGENSIESHIYGLSFYYLILANKELNNKDKVQYWHKKLINTVINDKETILQKIEELNLVKE